ncbi:MAG: translation initiation factor IF-1 [Candidatus Nomurabacteria bacterium]|nr:translation initiation factor IF-1 [Candidatus Nomurabacteria bacterium]
MSDKSEEIRKQGIVSEALPNTMFRVLLNLEEGADGDQREEIISYLAGKMRMHRIRVMVGDKVEVVIDPYGGKARLVKRL